jgi:hypothetical protein
MSSILYYSNFCEHSKKLLQLLSKTHVSKDIHFLCIDRRVKESDGKIYLLLENGQKIVMPETVTKVPALLLLKENYKVLYGDLIYEYMKPMQEVAVKQATQNNMEPMAFSLGGGSTIQSDQYSFLDMDADALGTRGNGGLRQMHSYVTLQESMNTSIATPSDDFDTKQKSKLPEGLTLESLQQMREKEIHSYQSK